MPKRPVNLKSAVDATLADLQSEYDRLVGSLRELAHLRAALEANPTPADRLLEERRERVQDQLHAIAHKIAEEDAHDWSAVAVKARVLLDWCERDRDDIVNQLMVSLCRDLLRATKTDRSDQDVPGS